VKIEAAIADELVDQVIEAIEGCRTHWQDWRRQDFCLPG
jgi:hypothetical protein